MTLSKLERPSLIVLSAPRNKLAKLELSPLGIEGVRCHDSGVRAVNLDVGVAGVDLAESEVSKESDRPANRTVEPVLSPPLIDRRSLGESSSGQGRSVGDIRRARRGRHAANTDTRALPDR